MMFGSPIYNAILFYILIVITILIIKPSVMYNHKTKKFKSFGCSEEGDNQTMFAFPLVALSSAITLYFFFLFGSILNNYLEP